MEKLTQQDIQFIDNYLLKSEVVYKDIRYEMVDHVATAVEQRMVEQNEIFYDAFKAYMVENKKSLLKQTVFTKKIAKDLSKEVIVNTTNYITLIVFVLALISCYFLDSYYGLFEYKNFFSTHFTVIFGLPILFVLLKNKFNSFKSLNSGERYSIVSRLFLLVIATYNIFGFSNIFIFRLFESYLFVYYAFLVALSYNFSFLLDYYINRYSKVYA